MFGGGGIPVPECGAQCRDRLNRDVYITVNYKMPIPEYFEQKDAEDAEVRSDYLFCPGNL